MRYFDLHCDTLYRAVTENGSLCSNDFHISLDNKNVFEKWAQCFALWIPDDMPQEDIDFMFQAAARKLNSDAARAGFKLHGGGRSISDYTAVLTVEGGRIIGRDLSKIKTLANFGVKMLTLTWNGDNEIACGAKTKKDTGLTEFGKKAVEELENNGIIIDVSHLSDKSFYDVVELAARPPMASHSNSRVICKNKRNLTDEQFNLIKDCGGIVGLNFHRDFLNDDGEKASITDIIRHCEHFLSLGGENAVAIGSDFDGADMPEDISGVASIPKIYNEFLKLNYSETLLGKLFWSNASKFFETFDNK